MQIKLLIQGLDQWLAVDHWTMSTHTQNMQLQCKNVIQWLHTQTNVTERRETGSNTVKLAHHQR